MKTCLTILICCLSMSLFAQKEKVLGASGNDAYKRGNFAMADSLYGRSLAEAPKFEEALFNQGDALYRQGDFDGAVEKFQKLSTESKDASLKAAAYHNLGNSLLSKEEFGPAAEAYKNALRTDPKDEDSRYNLAYANKMLQQQQEQEQQQDKDGEEGEDDQEKEGDQEQDKEGEGDQEKDGEGDKEGEGEGDKEKDGDKEGEDKNEKDGQGDQPKEQPVQEGQISKEDAARLLESLKKNEQEVQRKVRMQEGKQGEKGKAGKIEKDW
jgi:Ca-activated chloride channel homolog